MSYRINLVSFPFPSIPDGTRREPEGRCRRDENGRGTDPVGETEGMEDAKHRVKGVASGRPGKQFI